MDNDLTKEEIGIIKETLNQLHFTPGESKSMILVENIIRKLSQMETKEHDKK